MRITRYPNLNESQFLGCATAFVDSLVGELNGAAMNLRRLEGQPKGAAFAYEMSLDRSRYGALVVLDRWATLVDAFGKHLHLSKHQSIIDEAPGRVLAAENILGRANQLLDATPQYGGELVNACVLAFHSLHSTFAEEKQAADEAARLGPLLPDDYRQARRVFLEDLAAR
ncbi:MAG TPA: hypothetical protein VFA33_25190 [Bryobacteraceae bacterium]|nr:hypothetical protein [Bryobacteraceae bacterium]